VNPAVGVEVAKREHHESGTLSAEELERLVDAVPDRYRAFVLVAAYSSLRWSALVALRVDRLDLPRNRIRVEERITESGRLIYGAPKTARPRRAVTIPHTITLELAEHLRRYPRGRADSSSPRSTAASFVGRRSTGSSGTRNDRGRHPRVQVRPVAAHRRDTRTRGWREPSPRRASAGSHLHADARAALCGAAGSRRPRTGPRSGPCGTVAARTRHGCRRIRRKGRLT
jgi:integrase